MKLAVALTFATIAATALEDFDVWKATHAKQYGSLEDERAARARFHANVLVVQRLNDDLNDGATYSLAGPFADMSTEQFVRDVLVKARPPVDFAPERQLQQPVTAAANSSWDWRDHGAVTTVKNQGTLGTCWAFSTVGNLEGQFFLKKNELKDLSVEQLVECDAMNDAKNGTADCGEFGGWPYLAYQYYEKAGGVRFDSEMPYCSGVPFGKPGNCMPCMAEHYSKKGCGSHDDDFSPLFCNKSTTKGQGPAGLCSSTSGMAAQVSGWKWVSFDEDQIASTLAEVGPLSVALNAQLLQFYHKGIFNPRDVLCNKQSLDHGVLIVGFGVDKTAKYWTVKNSWGQKWGEQGYFRIVRGTGKCGINTQVTTGVLV